MSSQLQPSAPLRVGALVIGSLFWERDRWSPNVVNFDAAVDVPAPIRYWRVSESRGLAYSMILSPGSPSGNAKLVPFQDTTRNFADVVDAATELASAEGLSRSTLSSSWGCIGLLGISATTATIVQQWRKHMVRRATRVRAGYSDLTPIDSDAVLAPGLLPATLDAFDLLLVTVTAPSPPLPSVERVVDAMNAGEEGSKGVRYFRENVRHGIATFQDADIAAALRTRGVVESE